MKNKNRTFSTQEIADLLGVSASSIQRWADSGKLKCIRSENDFRQFSVENLKEFAEQYNIAMRFLDDRTITVSNNENFHQNVAVSR